MPITGRIAQRAGRVQPGIVETRDHVRVRALRLALGDAFEQARHREGIVIGALDRGRTEGGFDRPDGRAGARDLAAARAITAVIAAVVLGLTILRSMLDPPSGRDR